MEIMLANKKTKKFFDDVKIGQIFIVSDYVYLKLSSSDCEDNSFCVGDLKNSESKFYFSFFEDDTTVDEIIPNAKIVW